ncbi:uncharacterized protein LOC101449700 [Ceratitis capitata]|uniref:(Mediterranean fruit fly) hypothetical protein n=1 Tax=Ceratitis capitata TaxID=7213 RepID=A0A811V5T6_CERCA|nr:uncharacterized protein LOC101449700 [Ceratitis capitata]CAD7011498.1 unnamed protein product [Ceratitis capitata]
MVRLNIIMFAAKARVPLIKFRKGGPSSSEQSYTASGKSNTTHSTAIEDWELPGRYARKPIDKIEMEYINNGGIL